VRVTDEDGLVGLGQSACWAYPAAVDAVVDVFRPYLVGAEAGRIEDHWHQLHRMGPFRGSVVSGAVSAVDIALWDLKGRRLQVPVYELLGGLCRDRLRLQLVVLGWSTLEELRARVGEAVAEGYTAIKFDPLPAGYADLSQPRLADAIGGAAAVVREAVGPDVDVIVELHRSLPPLHARTVLDAVAPIRPLYIEDPVQIDSIGTQADMAGGTRAPLAQGERLHSIWEVRDLLERGGPEYVRTDVGLAGGISHARKLAALAEAHGAQVSWHTFSGPVVTAAAAHVGFTVPNVATHEWYAPLDEPGAIPALEAAMVREGGWLLPADAPGLGVTFHEERLVPFDLLGRPLHAIPRRQDGSVAFAV
jgi:galactonate dehydratase